VTAASSAPAAFCAGVSRGILNTAEAGTLLNLRVAPGAQRTSIEGPYGEIAVRLKVAAPPADGRANAEVKRFLAELSGVPHSNVAVIWGTSSRDKTVLVQNLTRAEAQQALSSFLP
jgi:uncharacterized protein (TIGR00251 family)